MEQFTHTEDLLTELQNQLNSTDRSRVKALLLECPSPADHWLIVHAAFPVALTSDLLYKIWVNFRAVDSDRLVETPVTVVAQIILSPVCYETSMDLYEIYPAIRTALLQYLQQHPHWGRKRLEELARFLLAYVDQCRNRIPSVAFAEAQNWIADAYINPERAAQSLLSSISEGLHKGWPNTRINYFISWAKQMGLHDTNNLPVAIQRSNNQMLTSALQFAEGVQLFKSGNTADAANKFKEIKDVLKSPSILSDKRFQTQIPKTVWDMLAIDELQSSLDKSLEDDVPVPDTLFKILIGHNAAVTCLLIYKNNIISGSDDNTIRIWDKETGKALMILEGHTNPISTMLLSGNTLISGSDDATIRTWELESGKLIQTLIGHGGRINALAIHNDNLISGSDDGCIKSWNMDEAICLQTCNGHSQRVSSLMVGNSKVISGSWDNSITIWQIETGECLRSLTGHTAAVQTLLFKGYKIFSGSYDGSIGIWNIENGELLRNLSGHTDNVSSLALHQNIIISGSRDNTIRIWDIESGQCLFTLQGHSGWIKTLMIRGNKILSGSYDGTIRIWEIQTGMFIGVLQGHAGPVSALVYADDKIISGSYDGSIRIWDMLV